MAKARVKAKHKRYKPKPRELRSRGWAVLGFDISMSSIAAAGIGYDATLKKFRGPEFTYLRWEKDDEYFDRLKEAAGAQLFVENITQQLGLILKLDEIFIAQEEPWPLGMVRGGASAFMKQQAEISGAFLGGLVKWGYTNVSQMNSIRWRTMVAEGITENLGEPVTTHHSKWKSPVLAQHYNCAPKDSGKFRSKQWALDVMAPWFGQAWGTEIPDWPDIVRTTKEGNHPRPEGSTAKAIQPDDRYDALAVMWQHYLELVTLEAISPTTFDKLTGGE